MTGNGAMRQQGMNRWLEALEWHTTLCEADASALTSGRLRAWQQWYAQPDNQKTFDNLSQLLAERASYRQPTAPSAAELESDHYDPSVPLRVWRKAQQAETARGRLPSLKSTWVKASSGLILAAAAVLVGVLILRPSWVWTGRARGLVYRTPVGQLTKVHLPDGSTVTLGGDTKLSVDYTARRRSIQLLRGEAWFRDREFPNWPFEVTAGDRTITALGTAFVVNRDADRVVVMVTAGTVQVSERAHVSPPRIVGRASSLQAPRPTIRLVRDQELTYSDDGTVGRVIQTDRDVATAWTQGRLVFDDVPLRYVVDNVDRYWSRRIRVSPHAGALRFSGLVYEDQIEDWLAGLSRIFPVVVDNAGTDVCVHMRDSIHTPQQSACTESRH